MIILPDQGNFRYFSQPRSLIRVNNKIVPFQSWSVEQNSYSAADTFTLDLPFRVLDSLRGATDLINTPTQETILLTQSTILNEVYAGYPRDPNNYGISDLTQYTYGNLDTVDFYFDEQGERIEIQGRNMVAPFMDNKTTEKFPNQTSSAIVSYFGTKHGLSLQVTPTYTLAGSYYSGDNVQLTSDITEWDLMQFLAEQEGFTLRVRGNTLYFGPRNSFLKKTPLPYTWGQNIKSLQLTRNPHASKDIKVEVISWKSNSKTRITASVGKGTSDNAWVETYYIPGITHEQAQQKAQSIYDQLSQSENVGQMTVDGNDQMDIDTPIILQGTGVGMTLQYWPTKVTHNFDFKSGSYSIDISFSNLQLTSDTGGL